MIDEQVFRGNWTEIRGRVKERWGELTDDDLVQAEGHLEQLIGIVQRKTGESREKIEHEIDRITQNYGTQMDRMRQQASSVATAASDSARQYADQASEMARRQYDQFHQQYDRTAAEMRARYADAEAAIRRSPVESLLVAFGTGLLAGVVVGLSLRASRD